MSIIRKNSKNTFEEICTTYFSDLQIWKEQEDAIDILVSLIKTIRPKKPKEIESVSIIKVLHYFIQNPLEKEHFIDFIDQLLDKKNADLILTDAGILQETDFFYEVRKRIFAKVLPYQAPKKSLQYVLNQIFYHDSDPIWINKIPKKELEELFDLLEFRTIYNSIEENSPLYEVLQAMNLLYIVKIYLIISIPDHL
jgi:site-specific recombinase